MVENSSYENCSDGIITGLFRNNFAEVDSVDFWMGCSSTFVTGNTGLIFLIIFCVFITLVAPTLLLSAFCRLALNKPFRCYQPREILNEKDRIKRIRTVVFCLRIYLIISVFAFGFFVASLYYSVQLSLLTSNGENNSSFNTASRSVLDSAELAVQYTLNDTEKRLTRLVDDAYPELDKIMADLVSSFIDRLLEDLNVTQLFSSADELFLKFASIQNATKIITLQKDYLDDILVVYEDALKEFIQYFRRLPNICSNLNTDLQRECSQFLNLDESRFDLIFSPKNIDLAPAEAVLTFLERFDINLTKIQMDLLAIKTDIDHQKGTISSQLLSGFLDIENIRSSIRNLLSNVNSSISKYTIQSRSLFSGQQFDRYILIGIISITCVSSVLFLFNIVVAFYIYHRLKSCLSPKSYQEFDYSISCTKLYPNRHCRHAVNSYLIIRCILLIILFIISVVISLTSFTLQKEVCFYLIEPEGIRLLDELIDQVVSKHWDNLLDQLTQITNFTPDFSLMDYIQLEQPKRLYSALLENCPKKEWGILKVLGMRDLFDLRGLINSTYVAKFLQNQKPVVAKQVADQDLAGMLGSSDGLVGVINQAKDLTKSLIDDVDHSENILEVEKPILVMPNPVAFFEQFSLFMRTVNPYLRDNDDVILYYLSVKMNNSNQDYKRAIYGKDYVIKPSLLLLQMERNMTARLDNLTNDFLALSRTLENSGIVLSFVPNIYDSLLEPLKTDVFYLVSKYIRELENSAVPCDKLISVVESLNDLLCRNVLSKVNYFAIFFMVFLVLFEILLFVFYFMISKADLLLRNYEGKC